MKIKGVLNRILYQDKQTLGWFTLYDGVKKLMQCAVLELADNGNKTGISSICSGRYAVKKRNSPKFGDHFILMDVKGREYILIHKGNYHTNIRGCLLFGEELIDINNDGYLDVTNSTKTMGNLLNVAPDEWVIYINDIR
ncbi:DUF5675 family protein [Polaribacter sp. IC073]|uniref:DUF5675 family protein n=1 Tax=Polaribacter sp. IC073 TaxID=2508540 RepID=UPI0011BDF673|nr:DUF5675 family protein [Polaribacter sp. IC073]TXD47324.1 hypothetical protein ES045_12055 [Polaribacter sp. IC073]